MQIVLTFFCSQRACHTLFGKCHQIFDLAKINAIGAIPARNRQLRASWAEGYACEPIWRMKGQQFFASQRVPEFGGFISTRRRDSFAVQTEGDTKYSAAMAG